jgi:hypothetical protein
MFMSCAPPPSEATGADERGRDASRTTARPSERCDPPVQVPGLSTRHGWRRLQRRERVALLCVFGRLFARQSSKVEELPSRCGQVCSAGEPNRREVGLTVVEVEKKALDGIAETAMKIGDESLSGIAEPSASNVSFP